ncbi:hypothetical protein D3C80_1807530 [compost metagenome]
MHTRFGGKGGGEQCAGNVAGGADTPLARQKRANKLHGMQKHTFAHSELGALAANDAGAHEGK